MQTCLKNKKYGMWTVICKVDSKKRAYWKCMCKCGTVKNIRQDSLVSGNSLSCGCRRKFNEYTVKDGIVTMYSNGVPFVFDEEHLEEILKYYWSISYYGYVVNISNEMILHRVIMNCPKGLQVDHIDGNRLNNVNANLRIVTNQQNSFNRDGYKKGNSSGHRGVYWDKRAERWEASIRHDYKKRFLGYYDDIDEAIRVRLEAEEKYFKDYSYENSRGDN